VTKKQRQAEEVIKRQIMDGYQRGVCDKNGDSITVNGRPKAPPKRMRPTTVYKNGKWSKLI